NFSMADERDDQVARDIPNALEDREEREYQLRGGRERSPLLLAPIRYDDIRIIADFEARMDGHVVDQRGDQLERQAAARNAIVREQMARADDEDFARRVRRAQEERDRQQREDDVARRRMRQIEEEEIMNGLERAAEMDRQRRRWDRQDRHARLRAILREGDGRGGGGAERDERQPQGQPNEGNDLIQMEAVGGGADGAGGGAPIALPDGAQRARDRWARIEQRLADRNGGGNLDRMHRLMEMAEEQDMRRLREVERREALRDWRRRRRDDEGREGGEARDEEGELFDVADGDPIRMRWPWMRNLRWEDEEESDSDGDVTEQMIDEAKNLREKEDSAPFSARFSRACLICVTENPRQRAVFIQCGHIVCFSCAVDNARSHATKGKCVFCQKKSAFVKLFEDLDSIEKNKDLVTIEKKEMKTE
ncbi:hypothetical protein PRIPAC_93489, partial [Pristionchus pacificus]